MHVLTFNSKSGFDRNNFLGNDFFKYSRRGAYNLIIRIIHKLRKNSKQKTHGPHRSHEQFLTNTRSLRQCYMIIFTCTEEEILTQNVLCHVCINLSSGFGEENF